MKANCLLPVLAFFLAGCSTLPPITHTYGPAVEERRIEDKRLNEISGMALSHQQDGVLWMHNDSGDEPRLFAVGADGQTLGVLEITNATARDWEELSLFEIDGEPWILIGDVGDNDAVRHDTVIYLLPEPDPAAFATQSVLRVAAEVVLPFRYEDGPRDCEGIAVDVERSEILLISKRTEPPVLYRLPLELEASDDIRQRVAERLAPFAGIVPPTAAEKAIPGRKGKYRSQVSAFDISPDNRTAAVLTYGNIYLYDRQGSESWTEAITRQPERVLVPDLPQSESITFDADGQSLLLSTEGVQPPVLRLPHE